MPDRSWIPLGAVDPKSLTNTRLLLHHAAQMASAAGTTLLPDRGDFTHTNFTWSRDHGALVGQPIPGGERAALQLAELRLMVLDEDGGIDASLSLVGQTRSEGLAWLAGQLDVDRLRLPGHEMPDHPVLDGDEFDAPDPRAAAELVRWYEDADMVLRAARARIANAAPVYCWPHHFDIATLVELDPSKGSEEGRTIGIGMSPGDQGYPQPYFYVTPWPYPEANGLPDLDGGGRWHTEGWVGALLLGTDLQGDDQRARVEAFLGSAVTACRELLTG